MLEIQLAENGLIFDKPEGNPLRLNAVTYAWTMIVKKAGIKPTRLHDIRHTHASVMLKQGVHLK
jgi:integrase